MTCINDFLNSFPNEREQIKNIYPGYTVFLTKIQVRRMTCGTPVHIPKKHYGYFPARFRNSSLSRISSAPKAAGVHPLLNSVTLALSDMKRMPVRFMALRNS